jgi:hypothetical protein
MSHPFTFNDVMFSQDMSQPFTFNDVMFPKGEKEEEEEPLKVKTFEEKIVTNSLPQTLRYNFLDIDKNKDDLHQLLLENVKLRILFERLRLRNRNKRMRLHDTLYRHNTKLLLHGNHRLILQKIQNTYTYHDDALTRDNLFHLLAHRLDILNHALTVQNKNDLLQKIIWIQKQW